MYFMGFRTLSILESGGNKTFVNTFAKLREDIVYIAFPLLICRLDQNLCDKLSLLFHNLLNAERQKYLLRLYSKKREI